MDGRWGDPTTTTSTLPLPDRLWYHLASHLHRSLLDGKESDLKAALEELEHERGKERILQAQQEEEQLRHLQKEGQSSKALEVTGYSGHPGQCVRSRKLPSSAFLFCFCFFFSDKILQFKLYLNSLCSPSQPKY